MTLSQAIVQAARPYLGLATTDMLGRIARNFLGCELADVRADQMQSLTYWLRISALKVMKEDRVAELMKAVEQAAAAHTR